MTLFPAADPIPLPAPVWLFKVLHNLTLTLHLAAVDLLLGGLMVGIILATLGRMRTSDSTQANDMTQASGMIAHRLPTVMAFLINLGVPPLLFAQVLYGRALYTSSVLIGAYWISVIFLLMASYYGLYYSSQCVNAQKAWRAPGVAALLLALTVAFIYTNNMTLMLRPEAWAGMYRHSPGGLQWNTADPALWPRWFFFVLGSLAATGATLMLLAQRAHFAESLQRLLFRAGGVAMAAGLLLQLGCVPLVLGAQPGGVMTGVMQNAVYGASAWLWLLTAAAGLAAALLAAANSGWKRVLSVAGALLMFLNVAATVMVRDGIRDVTLRAAGFEVWDRQVVTNWSVVGIFIVLLLAAVGALVFLIRVVAKARVVEEKYA